jgi:cytochrome d ubiquinol oxidase subunit II
VNTLAFVLLAAMIAVYVLLDGYDLGIAAITPLVARTEGEREASMRAIGPFWNGNEVWLIAAGGALFALFPQAYASAFSGFYLPFIMVLWLLMFRGIAMELRAHFPSKIWHDFWDFCFAGSSVLLIVLFGVALGNLLRGVPLDARGYFSGTLAFLLNPYALLVGATALGALMQHGLTFLMLRVNGPPADRAARILRWLWPVVALFYVATTFATIATRSAAGIGGWTFAIPLLSIGSLLAVRIFTQRAKALAAFASSCAFLATLLLAAAGTMYPYLLLGFPAGTPGISVNDAAPSPVALVSALAAVIVGLVAVAIYTVLGTRSLWGRIDIR